MRSVQSPCASARSIPNASTHGKRQSCAGREHGARRNQGRDHRPPVMEALRRSTMSPMCGSPRVQNFREAKISSAARSSLPPPTTTRTRRPPNGPARPRPLPKISPSSTPMSASDEVHMAQSLQLARRAGSASPGPTPLSAQSSWRRRGSSCPAGPRPGGRPHAEASP